MVKRESKTTTFRTFDPLDTEGLSKKTGFYITLIVLAVIILPIAFFMPTIEGKIVPFVLYLVCIIAILVTIKFYNWKYTGGTEVNVSRELVVINKTNYQRVVFSMNSIKKIVIWDKPTTESPDFNFITIYTSSSAGNIKLRFMEEIGKNFLKEILKYKQPKRKVSSKLRYWLFFSELERYYF